MVAEHGESIASIASQWEDLFAVASTIVQVVKSGGKVITCGNGGSASDAQHLAAELVGRFEGTRMNLRCVSLCTDSAVMTAVANDYGYDHVFDAQVAALGRPGDLLVAFTTSGTSVNVLNAARQARQSGMRVVGLIGANRGPDTLAAFADVFLASDSDQTPRIQEAHGFAVHAICDFVRRLGPR